MWSDRHATEIWAAAAFLPPAVAGLMTLGRPTLQDGHATLVLVLLVAVISAAGLSAPGVLAAFTAALAYDYSWTQPYGSLAIRDVSDVITVVLLLVVAVASGQLSRWGVRQQAAAAQQRNYLDAVETAAAASSASLAPSGLESVGQAVAAVLGVDRCRLVQGQFVGGDSAGSTQLQFDGSVTRGGRILDVDRWGLPTDDVIVVPVGAAGDAPVHFEVSAASQVARPSLEQRRVAALIARLAGAGSSQSR